VGTFGMLSGLLRGEHMPIFSFLLIFSDLLPILTGLVLWAGHFQCQDIIFFSNKSHGSSFIKQDLQTVVV